MVAPRLKNGLSLSERIRAFADEVENDVIAAELGCSLRVVSAIRSRARNAAHYRRQSNIAQNRRRARAAEARQYAWAKSFADVFTVEAPL